MKHILLLPTALLISACATQVTRTGASYPPTDVAAVKVFYTEKPQCALEELGVVVTPLKWNQESAIQNAKENAAKIGATHIQINNISRNNFNDAAVTVVAFRCKA